MNWCCNQESCFYYLWMFVLWTDKLARHLLVKEMNTHVNFTEGQQPWPSTQRESAQFTGENVLVRSNSIILLFLGDVCGEYCFKRQIFNVQGNSQSVLPVNCNIMISVMIYLSLQQYLNKSCQCLIHTCRHLCIMCTYKHNILDEYYGSCHHNFFYECLVILSWFLV